ncbi:MULTISPECIES: 3-hydroxyacyl-CoA dehydrogenase NAD-binding domain-containing protein [unclassified Polaromonas]|uniref:3-hydroxyacyl-CoA dehydrogenase NAD-binding domain-containing protein n=1 Tax=unclassified Polaromonas TaxID=2638319 RepID=UPI0018C8DD17|nr:MULTISPECIES: 3-hydroxyacyl-CoA dehydrogenase NAD-binding domain-containing protein [unclassified Polaromonas]MBG6071776.1 3-hydroxyacyl-CoA dehydrogenase [Polaromonas sp. CG_9.7]MBG6113777.1 3-hydroxyacyl-CoA dehydrogenase [Polaromonas sp. CG_9.2]MDH6184323.1 3-hydroxyacyl-CoA dehydrogenase [Polaromonas sp. CG_23.6]
MNPVDYKLRGSVAVLTLNNPPVNGLSFALRSSIVVSLDRALADPAVTAVVLTGGEKIFSEGADINEFGTSKSLTSPSLPDVVSALEQSPKPVVAAIAGHALGGGLELALGCHFRLAKQDATLGLPEVKLGLLPGAGGTQRLPRAIGLELALDMIVSGTLQKAASFAGTDLVDELVSADVVAAAVDFAERVVKEKRPLRRLRDVQMPTAGADAFLQFARNSVKTAAKGLPAPLLCMECVADSVTQPFEEGLKRERAAFFALMATPESRAARHVFAAERAAGKLPDIPADTPLRAIETVGVIGAGTMGGGIAMNFLNAGTPVVLLETAQEALDRGLATIRRNYENSAKRGKLTKAQVEQRMGLLTPTLDYTAFADVDLVIEAVFEQMDVKEKVFTQLDAVCKPGAILASNTSYLDINKIASFTKRPQNVLGLHFFSPANIMKLLEIVRGEKTANDVMATALALGKQIGKVAVVSGVCDGFIGNRMLARYGAAAHAMVVAGGMPQQIDKAMERFGYAMGPFRVGDLAGLDIGWATRKRKAAEAGVPHDPTIADKICELDRFGQKTGAGWYRYESGVREPQTDALIEKLIVDYRNAKGVIVRKVSDEEVVERCIFALVNEGARILAEGIAVRASDVDLVYLNGYGFPTRRGGPMCYANEVGLTNVVRALRRFAGEPGADASWQPAPLLVRLAENSKTFV